jgi:hypothetical protein
MSTRVFLPLALGVSIALPVTAAAGAVQSPERHDSHSHQAERGDWDWDQWMTVFGDFFMGPETKDAFRWQGTLASGKALEIKGVNGRITARPTGGNAIEVVALKHGRRSDPKQVEIVTIEHDGGVTLCALYPAPAGAPPNECAPGEGGRMKVRHNDVKVDFELKVPAGIALAARTVNGAVVVEGLGGNLRAHTVNGAIRASGVEGDVAAITVNGSVRLDARGTARAETVNGSIVADLGRADWTDRLEFETVNGSVTVTLPAGTNAELHVSTTNGGIRNEFDLAQTARSTRRELRGTIGKGGRELRISTVNGAVRLQRRGLAEARASNDR